MKHWGWVLPLFCVATSVVADRADDWQHQSYKVSKRLPDLHHAVGVSLADTMQPPEEFELDDGKLQCKTCHGLKDIEETAYDQLNTKATEFLRGGPYRHLNDFCYNCHTKKEHERPNIHILLDENGDIKKDHCLFCHEEVHEHRDQRLDEAQLKLRLPADKLCFGCHLKTPHFNAAEHQNAKPDDDMKRHMDEKAKEHKIILPLSDRGHVTCVSCHSPHSDGVMDENNPAGAQVSGDIEKGISYKKHSWDEIYQKDKQDRLFAMTLNGGSVSQNLNYQRLENEVLLRLPAIDGTLCLSCHEFDR